MFYNSIIISYCLFNCSDMIVFDECEDIKFWDWRLVFMKDFYVKEMYMYI